MTNQQNQFSNNSIDKNNKKKYIVVDLSRSLHNRSNLA